jgi:hypothetical protein
MAPMASEVPALPPTVFARALAGHVDLQVRRVFAMYNRNRALFAESVVAALLPGAQVLEDPSAAWDIVWPITRGPIRIQVKCSGEVVPHFPDNKGKARWDLTEPKHGWHPDEKRKIGPGHHCHAAVLARHTGADVAHGWSFFALRSEKIAGLRRVSEAQILAKGATAADAETLPRAIRRALRAK